MQCLKNRLLEDDISVNDAVEELRNICITISQQSFKKSTFQGLTVVKNTNSTTSGLMTIVESLKNN